MTRTNGTLFFWSNYWIPIFLLIKWLWDISENHSYFEIRINKSSQLIVTQVNWQHQAEGSEILGSDSGVTEDSSHRKKDDKPSDKKSRECTCNFRVDVPMSGFYLFS